MPISRKGLRQNRRTIPVEDIESFGFPKSFINNNNNLYMTATDSNPNERICE